MKNKTKKVDTSKTLLCLFLLFFLLIASVRASVVVSSQVLEEINSKGYADVIVFVEATLPKETQQLLEQQQFTVKTDHTVLEKILKEQKKAIEKQQQNILKKMDVQSIEKAIETREDISLEALESNNVDIVLEEKYDYINAFSGILTMDGYQILSHDTHVLGIYPNEELHLTLDSAVPFVRGTFPQSVFLNQSMMNGSGIGICVIDTGVDTTHPDLQGNIIDQYCYCSQGNGCCPNGLKEDTSAEDDNGHGTAVIGTIATHNSAFSGIATGAQIIAIKAFSNTGSATTGDVLSGINKCLERATTDNIKIFSMSFGGTTYSGNCDHDPFAAVANALVAEGFLVVAASGNNGDSRRISTPACASNVTSVGTVYDNNNSNSVADTVAGFSNANDMLDILAPGVGICTTKTARDASASTCFTAASGGKYRSYSGTSFSSPIIAGAAAVIAQYKQLETGAVLSPAELQSYLTSYGQPVLDVRNGINYPRLDLQNSLLHADLRAPLLQFMLETPANNSIVTTNSTVHVIINVSVQDAINDIVLCKISINGTNTTMNITGTGRVVSCTFSFMPVSSTSYIVYSMDANGNIGSTEERVLLVPPSYNNPPLIIGFEPASFVTIIIPENKTFFVNATDVDSNNLSYSWMLHESGRTTGTNLSAITAITNTTASHYTFISEMLLPGNYTLSAGVTDGIDNASFSWNISLLEQNPSALDVAVIPSLLYRTDNAYCSYTYSSPFNATENGTTILWYANNILLENLTNVTNFSARSFAVGQLIQCSVIPFDGVRMGRASSSAFVIVKNNPPSFSDQTIQNRTLNETDQLLLEINVTDLESDIITITANDSRVIFSNTTLILETNINSSGVIFLELTAHDGYDNTTAEVFVTILDAVDHDNDGVADFKDNDDDGDGLNDTIDLVEGNATVVNLSAVSVLFDNSSVQPNRSNEFVQVSFAYENKTIIEFPFNFTQNNLSLYTVEILNESSTNGNIVIRNLNITTNKTVFISKTNTSAAGVCILDTEYASLSNMSEECSAPDEYFVPCNGVAVSNYSCIEIGGMYQITGLHHSAVQQKCVDSDRDGYGNGCAIGTDCDDTHAAVNPSIIETADNGIDDNCDGISLTSAVAVPVEETATTTATGAVAGGGGGGGGGESSFGSEQDAAENDQAASGAQADTAQESSESQEASETSDSVATAESTQVQSQKASNAEQTRAKTQSTSKEATIPQKIFQLTGAAVSDLGSGKFNTKSSVLLIVLIFVGVGLCLGAYRMQKKKNLLQKEKRESKELSEYFRDLGEGFKDYFRK